MVFKNSRQRRAAMARMRGSYKGLPFGHYDNKPYHVVRNPEKDWRPIHGPNGPLELSNRGRSVDVVDSKRIELNRDRIRQLAKNSTGMTRPQEMSQSKSLYFVKDAKGNTLGTTTKNIFSDALEEFPNMASLQPVKYPKGKSVKSVL